MFGSRRDHQRASLASRLIILCSILSRVANSSLAQQGLSGDPSNIATRRRQNRCRRAARRSPPSVRTSSRLKSVMPAASCSVRCCCDRLVPQPPQPTALPPSSGRAFRSPLWPIIPRTADEKRPVAIFDQPDPGALRIYEHRQCSCLD